MNKHNYYEPNGLGKFLHKRVIIFSSTLCYFLSLVYCFINYASVNWQEYGYYFKDITIFEWIFCFILLIYYSFIVPKFIDRPSSLFLIISYIFIIIPSLVACVSLPDTSDYYVMQLIIFLGYTFASIMSRTYAWLPNNSLGYERKLSNFFLNILVLFWSLLLIVLIAKYKSIMQFSSLDTIYLQRAEGAADSFLWGYAQIYFGYVFSPMLLTIGLNRRNFLFMIMGFFGAIVLYMITAEKAVFTMPLFVMLIYITIKYGKIKFYTSTSFFSIFFALLLCFSTFFSLSSRLAEFIAWYLGVRTFLTPGAFIVFYKNYFEENGYTYFSHIRGINLFVEAPMKYTAGKDWPAIGKLVGENYLKMESLNANANFIASDAIASYGNIGIILIFILYTAFIITLDRITKGISLKWVIPILLPLALGLVNGSLFTMMTSFGGFLYLIIFYYFFNSPNIQNVIKKR